MLTLSAARLRRRGSARLGLARGAALAQIYGMKQNKNTRGSSLVIMAAALLILGLLFFIILGRSDQRSGVEVVDESGETTEQVKLQDSEELVTRKMCMTACSAEEKTCSASAMDLDDEAKCTMTRQTCRARCRNVEE